MRSVKRSCGGAKSFVTVALVLAVFVTAAGVWGHGALPPPPPKKFAPWPYKTKQPKPTPLKQPKYPKYPNYSTTPTTPQPEAPPTYTTVMQASVVTITPPRWSWLHWWEANRDLYLADMRQSWSNADPAAYPPLPLPSNPDVAEVLTVMLEKGAPVERATAALALGKMDHEASFDALKKAATKDGSEWVRFNAVLALSLLDTEQVEPTLTEIKFPTGILKQSGYTAFGLMTKPSEDAIKGLSQTAYTGDGATGPLAVWALRQHAERRTMSTLVDIALRSESPWQVSEALLGLGGEVEKEEPGLRTLLDVLGSGNQAVVMRGLSDVISKKKQQLAEIQSRTQFGGSSSPPSGNTKVRVQTVRFEFGVEETHIARLRASAAIALGKSKHPDAVRGLVAMLDEQPDEFNTLPKGFALMSLAQIGRQETLAGMLRILGTFNPNVREEPSPLRGYAALALGLYARPVKDAEGQTTDRPGFRDAVELLAKRLADPKEFEEVRSACAVALGLSQRTEALKVMRATAERLNVREELVFGHILLGMGMLRDPSVAVAAKPLLRIENDKTDMPEILARRAAVLGVGLCGSSDSVALLKEAWHLNYHVNREVVLALSLCKAEGLATMLTEEIRKTKNAEERAYFAMVLGELLCSERPQKLSRFAVGSNYTFKFEPQQPYQKLANEFFFDFLISAFGDEYF